MANLVDNSFFVGEINIPNTTKPEIAQSLDLFINKYEKSLLQQIMGYELWKLYDTDPAEQRFVDLINGKEYDGCDGKEYWRGLVYDGKNSLIAYHIYWWWVKDKSIWNGGIGLVRAKPDSAEVMPIFLKVMEAWNTCSTQICEFVNYMNASLDVYPEWKPKDLWQLKPVNDFDI